VEIYSNINKFIGFEGNLPAIYPVQGPDALFLSVEGIKTG
jgi:hypothetical protein